MGIITYLFSYILTKEEAETAIEAKLFLLISAYVLIGYFSLIEFLQLKDKGPKRYFINLYNVLDLMQISLNTTILLRSHFEIQPHPTTIVVALTIMWMKVFYFMRLYSSLAFYVTLLLKTIRGIGPFTFVLLVALLWFTNLAYIYN